jgi:hypothetical protein
MFGRLFKIAPIAASLSKKTSSRSYTPFNPPSVHQLPTAHISKPSTIPSVLLKEPVLPESAAMPLYVTVSGNEPVPYMGDEERQVSYRR